MGLCFDEKDGRGDVSLVKLSLVLSALHRRSSMLFSILVLCFGRLRRAIGFLIKIHSVGKGTYSSCLVSCRLIRENGAYCVNMADDHVQVRIMEDRPLDVASELNRFLYIKFSLQVRGK